MNAEDRPDRSTPARLTLLAVALGVTALVAALGGLWWPEPAAGGDTYTYATSRRTGRCGGAC